MPSKKSNTGGKDNTFNAQSFRSLLAKEKASQEELGKAKAAKIQQRFERNIDKRIKEIPKILKKRISDIVKLGPDTPNRVAILNSLDNDLGVDYIPKETEDKESKILSFPAAKAITEWAVSRKFGYEISTCNGYWALYLTW